MKSLCCTNYSETPIISVIGRLIVAEIHNAAVIHHLSLAKANDGLPDISEYNGENKKVYGALRHAIAKCGTFAGLARALAKSILL